MAEEFPEVEHFVRFSNPTGGFLSSGDHDYQLERITFADSALFDVFSFPLLKGNPKTALQIHTRSFYRYLRPGKFSEMKILLER